MEKGAINREYLKVFKISALSILLGAVMICAISIILLKSGLKSTAYFPLLNVVCFAIGVIPGFIIGKSKRKQGIVNGLLCGILPASAVLLAMTVANKGFMAEELIPFAVCLVAAVLGSILGVNKKAKKPKFKK